jgi:flagellar biosynthetic protein FliS
MYPAYGGNQANTYLAQRINSASAEELAAMLLAGAERFLREAGAAIRRKDYMEKARLINRSSDIVQALVGLLNPDGEAQLVDRLHGIYVWWIKEMFEASMKDRPEQLDPVVKQMASLRGAWEELTARQARAQIPAQPQAATAPVGSFTVEGLVG